MTATLPPMPPRPHTRLLAGLMLCLLGLAGAISQRQMIAPGLPALAAAVAGYAGLVVLLTSLADRLDSPTPSGAYADFGRYFFALGAAMTAFGLALAATRSRYPQDLLLPEKAVPMLAIAAALIAVFWYLAQRTSGRAPIHPAAAPAAAATVIRQGESSGAQWAKGLLALVLVATAAYLLMQRLNEQRTDEDREEQLNAEERAKAPPWTDAIDSFVAGTRPEELRNKLSRSGYRVYCPRNIRPGEKVSPDNKAQCWALIKTAQGIPAKIMMFWFNDEGLTSYVTRFEPGNWSAVVRHLDDTGQRVNDDLGLASPSGPPVAGWRFDNGLVMSADGDANGDITVLWTARDSVVQAECADRQSALVNGKARRRQNIEAWWPGTECGALPLPR